MEYHAHGLILVSIQLYHLGNIYRALQLESCPDNQLNVVVTKQLFLHPNGLLVHQVIAFLELQAEAYRALHGAFHPPIVCLRQHRQVGIEEPPCSRLFDYLNPINFLHQFYPEALPFLQLYRQNNSLLNRCNDREFLSSEQHLALRFRAHFLLNLIQALVVNSRLLLLQQTKPPRKSPYLNLP